MFFQASFFFAVLACCGSDPQQDSQRGSRNLVLGTQRGLHPYEFRVFVASLRATGCMAQVVIFSAEKERQDLEEIAEAFDAEIRHYDPSALSAKHGPMNLHRFELFRQYLADSQHVQYDQVLLCDIRDVFFQLDPFISLRVTRGIGVAIEPSHFPIRDCDVHVRWLTSECPSYLTEQMLEQVGARSRSCAGTTIGTREGIWRYISVMQEEAVRTVMRISKEDGQRFADRITTEDRGTWYAWCNDQGMHNVLLWTGKFGNEDNVTMYDAENSLLATVGTMEKINTNSDGDLMVGCSADSENCEGGRVAALVHQYDRVKPLTQFMQSLYGAEGETFLTFQERYGPGPDGDFF